MNLRWLMRAARWARNPPSAGQVKMVLAILAICIGLFLVERFIGWPEALSVNSTPRGRIGF
ncbi:hypothetical protein [Rhodovulum adriaticum]|uniref:Uncharacterized protein n=1 Tax=Rhodovulum adriaticum TaxID=35804 RepID=A0A4R2NNE8_RHOAD|nr:hypothetical protein [Rhodovulum adriaticum]MBK1634549.1 hypothetical protein [Rhodovulum adriaticum]TCP23082.1 hypothetical protein EV656_10451 [Rhodovulum adriaticum]